MSAQINRATPVEWMLAVNDSTHGKLILKRKCPVASTPPVNLPAADSASLDHRIDSDAQTAVTSSSAEDENLFVRIKRWCGSLSGEEPLAVEPGDCLPRRTNSLESPKDSGIDVGSPERRDSPTYPEDDCFIVDATCSTRSKDCIPTADCNLQRNSVNNLPITLCNLTNSRFDVTSAMHNVGNSPDIDVASLHCDFMKPSLEVAKRRNQKRFMEKMFEEPRRRILKKTSHAGSRVKVKFKKRSQVTLSSDKNSPSNAYTDSQTIIVNALSLPRIEDTRPAILTPDIGTCCVPDVILDVMQDLVPPISSTNADDTNCGAIYIEDDNKGVQNSDDLGKFSISTDACKPVGNMLRFNHPSDLVHGSTLVQPTHARLQQKPLITFSTNIFDSVDAMPRCWPVKESASSTTKQRTGSNTQTVVGYGKVNGYSVCLNASGRIMPTSVQSQFIARAALTTQNAPIPQRCGIPRPQNAGRTLTPSALISARAAGVTNLPHLCAPAVTSISAVECTSGARSVRELLLQVLPNQSPISSPAVVSGRDYPVSKQIVVSGQGINQQDVNRQERMSSIQCASSLDDVERMRGENFLQQHREAVQKQLMQKQNKLMQRIQFMQQQHPHKQQGQEQQLAPLHQLMKCKEQQQSQQTTPQQDYTRTPISAAVSSNNHVKYAIVNGRLGPQTEHETVLPVTCKLKIAGALSQTSDLAQTSLIIAALAKQSSVVASIMSAMPTSRALDCVTGIREGRDVTTSSSTGMSPMPLSFQPNVADCETDGLASDRGSGSGLKVPCYDSSADLSSGVCQRQPSLDVVTSFGLVSQDITNFSVCHGNVNPNASFSDGFTVSLGARPLSTSLGARQLSIWRANIDQNVASAADTSTIVTSARPLSASRAVMDSASLMETARQLGVSVHHAAVNHMRGTNLSIHNEQPAAERTPPKLDEIVDTPQILEKDVDSRRKLIEVTSCSTNDLVSVTREQFTDLMKERVDVVRGVAGDALNTPAVVQTASCAEAYTGPLGCPGSEGPRSLWDDLHFNDLVRCSSENQAASCSGSDIADCDTAALKPETIEQIPSLPVKPVPKHRADFLSEFSRFVITSPAKSHRAAIRDPAIEDDDSGSSGDDPLLTTVGNDRRERSQSNVICLSDLVSASLAGSGEPSRDANDNVRTGVHSDYNARTGSSNGSASGSFGSSGVVGSMPALIGTVPARCSNAVVSKMEEYLRWLNDKTATAVLKEGGTEKEADEVVITSQDIQNVKIVRHTDSADSQPPFVQNSALKSFRNNLRFYQKKTSFTSKDINSENLHRDQFCAKELCNDGVRNCDDPSTRNSKFTSNFGIKYELDWDNLRYIKYDNLSADTTLKSETSSQADSLQTSIDSNDVNNFSKKRGQPKLPFHVLKQKYQLKFGRGRGRPKKSNCSVALNDDNNRLLDEKSVVSNLSAESVLEIALSTDKYNSDACVGSARVDSRASTSGRVFYSEVCSVNHSQADYIIEHSDLSCGCRGCLLKHGVSESRAGQTEHSSVTPDDITGRNSIADSTTRRTARRRCPNTRYLDNEWIEDFTEDPAGVVLPTSTDDVLQTSSHDSGMSRRHLKSVTENADAGLRINSGSQAPAGINTSTLSNVDTTGVLKSDAMEKRSVSRVELNALNAAQLAEHRTLSRLRRRAVKFITHVFPASENLARIPSSRFGDKSAGIERLMDCIIDIIEGASSAVKSEESGDRFWTCESLRYAVQPSVVVCRTLDGCVARFKFKLLRLVRGLLPRLDLSEFSVDHVEELIDLVLNANR